LVPKSGIDANGEGGSDGYPYLEGISYTFTGTKADGGYINVTPKPASSGGGGV
jgi:hypothetical protein